MGTIVADFHGAGIAPEPTKDAVLEDRRSLSVSPKEKDSTSEETDITYGGKGSGDICVNAAFRMSGSALQLGNWIRFLQKSLAP